MTYQLTHTHMDTSKKSLYNFCLVSLLCAGVFFISIWSPSITTNPLFQNSACLPLSSNLTNTTGVVIDDLELALQKASTPNRTVIIAVVNKAYVEQTVETDTTMLDIFLESFWLGEGTRQLLDHLLMVAIDQTAYDRCMFKRLHCYRLVTGGVDVEGEKVYMSQDFIKMMWRRTLFLLDVLKRGYSFIFTDTDVMWLRNPLRRLSNNESEDLQMSVDRYNGDPWSQDNAINTGFYFVRSNNKTISLFTQWYGMKNNSTGMKEQDVLLELMRKDGLFKKLKLQVSFLPTLYFSGFCENSKDIRLVTTVHANCCRHVHAKLQDLKAVLRDWRRFKEVKLKNPTMLHNRTMVTQWSGHKACADSWKPLNNNLRN